MILLNAIFIAILLFIQRFSIARLTSVDFDTYGHLCYAKTLKSQKKGMFDSIRLQCWKPSEFSHPFLWHKLICLVPETFINKNIKILNIILEAFFVFALFMSTYYIFDNLVLANFCCLLYVFTPLLYTSFAIGARVQSLTPRLTSEIIFYCIILAVVANIHLGSSILYVVILCLFSAMILNSKFGVQALFFVIPIFSIYTFDLVLIFLLPTALCLVLVISQFKMFASLSSQFQHLKEYIVSNKDKKNDIHKRNNLTQLWESVSSTSKPLKSRVWHILATNSYTATIIKFPAFSYWFYLMFSDYSSTNPDIYFKLQAFCISSLILFMVINRPVFLFLGEAERYVSHCIIAFFILISEYSVTSNEYAVLVFLVLYGFLYYIAELYILWMHRKSTGDADNKVEKYLVDHEEERTVVSFPYHSFDLFRVMYKTQHRVLMPIFSDPNVRQFYKDNYEYKYGYIDLTKLNEIAEFTGLSICIIQLAALKNEGFKDWSIPDGWKKTKVAEEKYLVIEKI